jgi:hypothetical protein
MGKHLDAWRALAPEEREALVPPPRRGGWGRRAIRGSRADAAAPEPPPEPERSRPRPVSPSQIDWRARVDARIRGIGRAP